MEAVGDGALVGRMGGDEFVALIPSEAMQRSLPLIDQICGACDQFNRQSEKNYYV